MTLKYPSYKDSNNQWITIKKIFKKEI